MLKELLFAAGLIAAFAGAGQTASHDRAEGGTPAATQAAMGDAAAGRALFKGAGNCLSCHRVGAVGSVIGPNLTDVGSKMSVDEMKRQLLEPRSTVESRNRLFEVTLANGKSVKGKLMNQNVSSVQLLNADGDLVAYSRSEVREIRAVDPPQMPPFKSSLSSQQIDNLVAYLQSLRTSAN